jgi:subtilase family serine protease
MRRSRRDFRVWVRRADAVVLPVHQGGPVKPASPYFTAVGGTSLALNSDQSIQFQMGWGNTMVFVSGAADTAQDGVAGKNSPLAAPVSYGYLFGSTGGPSRVIPKPNYQRGVPGNFRQQPDISYLADPYTGVEVIQSSFDANGNPQPGNENITVLGGTSLSSPMFTGLWAVVNQAAGGSMGLAAPILYRLSGDAITDIVPVTSATNVSGNIVTPSGQTIENQFSLSLPETGQAFYSAFWERSYSPYDWGVLTFQTDSSLQVTTGWDNVTGLGVPNGLSFVGAVIND